MAFVRVYTGEDGQSHFEDLDLLPPNLERSVAQATTNLTFGRSINGTFHDYHNAPRRQYAIFMSGLTQAGWLPSSGPPECRRRDERHRRVRSGLKLERITGYE